MSQGMWAASETWKSKALLLMLMWDWRSRLDVRLQWPSWLFLPSPPTAELRIAAPLEQRHSDLSRATEGENANHRAENWLGLPEADLVISYSH